MKMIMVAAVVGMVCLGGGYVLGSSMSNNDQKLDIGGSSSVEPLMKLYMQEYSKFTDVKLNLSVSDSSAGVTGAMNGTFDIGMSSSTVTAAGAVATEICKDAIAIIVGSGVSVTNLTVAQLFGIYNGDFTTWDQVGGATSDAIDVFVRESGSGTRDAIEGMIRQGGVKPDTTKISPTIAESTSAMKNEVGKSAYAIGYVSLGSVGDANTVSVGGVAPSLATAMDGTYPLVRSFFLVTNGEPVGAAKQFISWILSPEGQTIAKISFVPLYEIP